MSKFKVGDRVRHIRNHRETGVIRSCGPTMATIDLDDNGTAARYYENLELVEPWYDLDAEIAAAIDARDAAQERLDNLYELKYARETVARLEAELGLS